MSFASIFWFVRMYFFFVVFFTALLFAMGLQTNNANPTPTPTQTQTQWFIVHAVLQRWPNHTCTTANPLHNVDSYKFTIHPLEWHMRVTMVFINFSPTYRNETMCKMHVHPLVHYKIELFNKNKTIAHNFINTWLNGMCINGSNACNRKHGTVYSISRSMQVLVANKQSNQWTKRTIHKPKPKPTIDQR